MNNNLWKYDRVYANTCRIQPSECQRDTAPNQTCHAVHMSRHFHDPNYNSVVNIARILAAEGVKDRAIERTVRAAAASGARAESVTLHIVRDSAAPSLSLSRNSFPRPNGITKTCDVSAAGKLPGISSRSPATVVPGFREKLIRQRSGKIGDNNDSNPSKSRDNLELHVRSISVPLGLGSAASSAVHRQLPPFHSSVSPALLAFCDPLHFKQKLKFEDNDLCAPFRQDLSVKKPVLNTLAPADATVERSNFRQSMLLQQTLKKSNLLGPGHVLVADASEASSNATAALGSTMLMLSKQHATQIKPETMMKRNFALT
jgi:hypothetical protein